MNHTIYTIGYSGFSVTNFIHALKNHGIRLLIDVRSSPYSSYHSEYNKETLKSILRQNGIYYRNYSKEFGARQANRALYTKDGYLNFELHRKTDTFQNGVKKLVDSLEQGYVFALMCAEKNPIHCHRAIMVSRHFSQLGYNVIHILPEGKEETQEDIDHQLLEKFFPNRTQESFFPGAEYLLDSEYMLTEAYRLQNKEIGYRMEEGL